MGFGVFRVRFLPLSLYLHEAYQRRRARGKQRSWRLLRATQVSSSLNRGSFGGPFYKDAVLYWGTDSGTLVFRELPMFLRRFSRWSLRALQLLGLRLQACRFVFWLFGLWVLGCR